jgi:hypothetical protein
MVLGFYGQNGRDGRYGQPKKQSIPSILSIESIKQWISPSRRHEALGFNGWNGLYCGAMRGDGVSACRVCGKELEYA